MISAQWGTFKVGLKEVKGNHNSQEISQVPAFAFILCCYWLVSFELWSFGTTFAWIVHQSQYVTRWKMKALEPLVPQDESKAGN